MYVQKLNNTFNTSWTMREQEKSVLSSTGTITFITSTKRLWLAGVWLIVSLFCEQDNSKSNGFWFKSYRTVCHGKRKKWLYFPCNLNLDLNPECVKWFIDIVFHILNYKSPNSIRNDLLAKVCALEELLLSLCLWKIQNTLFTVIDFI